MHGQLELPHTNARRTYMLDTYTIERRRKGWYFWSTYKGSKTEARGPYSSVASVCLMVARQLMREAKKRDAPFNLDG